MNRKKILEIHLRAKPLANDIDLEILAEKTDGYSGADLAALVSEATKTSVRRAIEHGPDNLGRINVQITHKDLELNLSKQAGSCLPLKGDTER